MTGISYCDGTYRMKRQDSAETVIEYIVEGRGYLNVNGENYAATAGDVYILRKKTTHTYWSDAKSPWVKIFFNIRGSLAERILDEYQLGGSGKVVLEADCLEQDFRDTMISTIFPICSRSAAACHQLNTERRFARNDD